MSEQNVVPKHTHAHINAQRDRKRNDKATLFYVLTGVCVSARFGTITVRCEISKWCGHQRLLLNKMDFYLIRVKLRDNLAFLKFGVEELDVNSFRQKGKH